MSLQHHLGTLGYGPGKQPTLQELKTRWKELCREHHPDKFHSESEDVQAAHASMFRSYTHAYNMLTDANYRNQELDNERKRGAYNIRGDLNIRVIVPTTFEDAFFGREVLVSYSRQHFDAKFDLVPMKAADVFWRKVHLPPGSTDGFAGVLELAGHICGDVSGNAEVQFAVKPHPKFRVQGGEVHATEKIPLDMMVKGGKLDVPTMYGTRTVRVKAGSKPGDQVKVPRCGVNASGYHVVTLEAAFPTKEELKGEAWKGLEIDWSEEPTQDQEEQDLQKMYASLLGMGVVTVTGGWR